MFTLQTELFQNIAFFHFPSPIYITAARLRIKVLLPPLPLLPVFQQAAVLGTGVRAPQTTRPI